MTNRLAARSVSQRAQLTRALLAFVSLCIGTPSIAQLPAWQARHPERPGTLVLLGSIHLLRATDHPLPAIVDDIYAMADTIVFELDLDDLAAADLQNQFMGAAMLPSDHSLEDMLEPSLYADATQAASRYGIDLRLFSRFEPWFVATMLMSFGLNSLGYEPQYGIEQYLLAKARRDGTQVLGLEALEAQVAVFDLLSEGDQAAFLEQTLAELGRDDAAMASLVAAWRDGELDSLQADLLKDFAKFPDLYDRLVVDRNSRWSAALAELTTNDAVFAVVVGALHLVGEHSVLEMLRERGFTISPLE